MLTKDKFVLFLNTTFSVMITYKEGNLFDSNAQAIVNTVNTVGVMGKGLALQFKEAYPDNYAIYRRACKEGLLHPGAMLITDVLTLDGQHRYIINFPTKTDWRKPSEYCYIESGLIALKKEIMNRNIKSIAIPPLGTRNGGLDWSKVRAMIEDILSDLDCEIVIYEPSEAIHEKLCKEKVTLTPARAMMLRAMVDMVAHGEFISEFAAEKIAYFLQRFGAQDVFKLTFRRGVYGPYSGKVKYVLHYLNGSYIMGMSDLSKRPFDEIWLTEDAEKASKEMLCVEDNKKYAQIVSKTSAFLSKFYSNFSLELLATVDYLLQTEVNLANWRTMDEQDVITIVTNDITDWNSRKERLFNKPEYIRIMLDHLRRSDLYA